MTTKECERLRAEDLALRVEAASVARALALLEHDVSEAVRRKAVTGPGLRRRQAEIAARREEIFNAFLSSDPSTSLP